MSAYTRSHIDCDHRDDTAPAGQRWCAQTVRSGERPDGSYALLTTKDEARAEAKRLGWLVRVRKDGTRGPGAAFDYCAAHSAAHKPQEG